MKTQTPFDEIAAIDRELLELAPRVRQGFECLGGPSTRVEQAIREEARAWPPAGASNVAVGTHLGGRGVARAVAGRNSLLVRVATCRTGDAGLGAAQPAAAAHIDESTASFASLLMEIQGLNEDGFFRTEEAESLWP